MEYIGNHDIFHRCIVKLFGNLFQQDLSEILESPRAKAIYDGFSNRRATEELCRKCGYARRFG
ncbi:MAG: SPASM domain-containing protein [Clostridia bacterium]|nr:SPASM domain-containing protein [Clostridia bacterium]